MVVSDVSVPRGTFPDLSSGVGTQANTPEDVLVTCGITPNPSYWEGTGQQSHLSGSTINTDLLLADPKVPEEASSG